MRGAHRQVHQLPQRACLLAGARAKQVKLHAQAMARRLFFVLNGFAHDPQRGAGHLQMRRRGGKQPVLQFLHQS